jgi:hypothetical protein
VGGHENRCRLLLRYRRPAHSGMTYGLDATLYTCHSRIMNGCIQSYPNRGVDGRVPSVTVLPRAEEPLAHRFGRRCVGIPVGPPGTSDHPA